MEFEFQLLYCNINTNSKGNSIYYIYLGYFCTKYDSDQFFSMQKFF